MSSFTSDKFIKHVYTAKDKSVLHSKRVSVDDSSNDKFTKFLENTLEEITSLKNSTSIKERNTRLEKMEEQIKSYLFDFQKACKNKKISVSINKLLKK